MPDKRPTVRDVVIAFTTVFGTSRVAKQRLATYLDSLRKDSRWTEEEVAEVRRLIEERLKAN